MSMEESMNRNGRPRKNGGLYRRGNSAVWWMRYRDYEGRLQYESTGKREREDAEKVLRKQLVACDEGLLPDRTQGAL